MEFIYNNNHTDKKIKDIKAQIRLRMNGIAADQMKVSGLVYKQNFGVSIPHLKDLAKNIEPNHDLALRLWFLGIRETMILATMIEPIEKMDIHMAKEWIKNLTQTEIIEIICMNLFSKIACRKELSLECIKSENQWEIITGYLIAARCYNDYSINEVNHFISRAHDLIPSDNLHIYKAIATGLSRFCRKNTEIKNTIMEAVKSFPDNEKSVNYIVNEINQEIDLE